MRLNIVLADKDEKYREAISDYILENENQRIRLITFSNEDLLVNYLENSGQVVDILITDAIITENPIYERYKVHIILLEDNDLNKDKNYKYIYKYQKGSEIITQIINTYLENFDSAFVKIENKITMFSIFAPCGSAKKEEIILKLSNYYGSKNRVLLITFNPFNQSIPIDSKDTSLSNVFYDIQTTGELGEIKKYTSKYTDYVDVISPFQNFLEYYDIKKENIQYFISKLRESNFYDCIVIELADDFGEVTRQILANTEKTYILYNFDSKAKIDKFMRNLELDYENKNILLKTKFVLDEENINLILDKVD